MRAALPARWRSALAHSVGLLLLLSLLASRHVSLLGAEANSEVSPVTPDKPSAKAVATPAGAAAEQADAVPPAPPVPVKEPPLIEQEPFDRITLDAENDNLQIKVYPLLDGKRTAPFPIDLRGKYRVRLLDKEGEFEIEGRRIVRLELFEELLLKEGRRLVAEGKFDEALPYYYLIRTNYPNLPGLTAAVQELLYLDAFQLTRSKQYVEALGLVEELYRMDRSYRYSDSAPTLVEFLSRLIDRLVNAQVEQGDYRAARQLLARVVRDYADDRPASVDQWREQLAQLALQRQAQAREHLQAERFHEALVAARQMTNIWPEVAGGQALLDELAQQYPLIVVGVLQPVQEPDTQRLDNWSARRTGRLLHRDMVEFLGAGPEGGRYEFQAGLIEHSDDRRRMTLRLNRTAEGATANTSYDVARWLLELADMDSPRYAPTWATLVASATVVDVLQVDVDLRRPHVLPEAVLRVSQEPPAPAEGELPSGDGPFAMAARSPSEVRFVMKGFRRGGRLAEIAERTVPNAQAGIAALTRGDIDVLDRIPPREALRLADGAARNLQVAPYALPTVHMLVPNTAKNPYLGQADFRRAIEYAIDRQTILNEEILGGREVLGCQVVSGPFPYGASGSDPLGYAYDSTIRPRPYDPRLAKLLSTVAQKQLADLALKRRQSPPELAPLVLGHPATAMAQAACQAIAVYLKVVGIDCVPQPLPAGETRDASGQCDLVYTEIAIWEPVVDAGRLFNAKGPAACESAYVRQTIRRLEAAENWGGVRQRLLDVHRAVYNEAAVIPLWQMVDYYAYDRRLRNVGEDLVWLYQNVDQWRISTAGDLNDGGNN